MRGVGAELRPLRPRGAGCGERFLERRNSCGSVCKLIRAGVAERVFRRLALEPLERRVQLPELTQPTVSEVLCPVTKETEVSA